MKKILSSLIALAVLLFCLPVHALSANAYLINVREQDMSGNRFQLYMMGCTGHYDEATGSATLYISNTSDKQADFEVCIGWDGSNPVTFVQSGSVTLKPGQMGKFVLTGLYDKPEKANDDLGYIPGTHLSGSSVIRIIVTNAQAGMKFVVAGIDSYGYFRNTSFQEPQMGIAFPAGKQNVDAARLVIADQETEEASNLITLEVPETEKVQTFLTIAVASAVLCAGGLILFAVRYFTKGKKHDGTKEV